MFLNFFSFILLGLGVGYLGYFFDLNKTKGLELYLFVGVIFGYLICLILNFLIWPGVEGELNYQVLLCGGILTYFSLRLIDYFFHL